MNQNTKVVSLQSLAVKWRQTLIALSLLQILAFCLTVIAVAYLRLGRLQLTSSSMQIAITALLGFAGALVYFSRKTYVYLIKDKFFEISFVEGQTEPIYERILSRMTGYFIYLSLRPLVGLVIGPMYYLVITSGLAAFVSIPAPQQFTLSSTGVSVLYSLAFIGGLTSSDFLDYLTRIGKRLLQS